MDSHAGFDGTLKPKVLTLTVRTFPSTFFSLVVIPILSVLGWYIISWATNPLNKYPGPFLAGFTNWWRLYQTRTGKYHEIIYDLHKKYGPIVRIGPNTLDLDYPELIKTIYSTDGKWLKVRSSQGLHPKKLANESSKSRLSFTTITVPLSMERSHTTSLALPAQLNMPG